MKKTIFLFALALFAFGTTSAQYNTVEHLDINKVKAAFLVHGDMFWDPANQQNGYEFPKGSGMHSNFLASIWIGGIDQSTNSIKVAAQTYRQRGNDYFPGPLDEFNGASIDSLTSANWAQIWKVNKTTIDSFRQLSNPTLANTPQSILTWPGRNANSVNGAQQVMGAVSGLLNIPDREMAPFVDVNNDNVYNPLDGDYPDIKGDQMLFWVINDKAQAKTNSGSDAIGLEIHASAYACTQEGLENTTFLNYKIHYWGTSIMNNFIVALFNDADVGYAFDDFMGYDSSSRMGVIYNGDAFDESVNGYGYNLTQTGTALIKQPADNANQLAPLASYVVYFPNPGIPLNPSNFYNVMQGFTADSLPFWEGCLPDTTKPTTKFLYPDDPSVINGISEPQCNNPPGDRRTVLGCQPIASLTPGSIPLEYTFAFINTDTGVNNSNFNELRSLADSAYKYANGCGQPMWALSVPGVTSGSLKVYPNPADSYFILEDADEAMKQVSLYNATGQLIFKEETKVQKLKINTRDYTEGIYFLKVEKGKDVYAQSILVK